MSIIDLAYDSSNSLLVSLHKPKNKVKISIF